MNSRIEKKLLHYTGKAIDIYHMIREGDKLLLCLSGGKDSFALVKLLHLLKARTKVMFDLHVLSIDKGFKAWNRTEIIKWLETQKADFTVLTTDIANIVDKKKYKGVSPCVLCSRLRRGHIYSFAKQYGYNKVVLGHHRDDLIVSLMMSILYSGNISSMPPKLITDDKKLIVIRPLVFCQEADLKLYAEEQKFPLSDSGLCSLGENSARKKVAEYIKIFSADNKKIPSNILHALSSVKLSQLMDNQWWNFKNLEASLEQRLYSGRI